MGMFDYLRCKAPLPDGYDAADVEFQTKSFPDPCLFRYDITSDGRLHDEWGRDCEPDGYITFYTRDLEAPPDLTDDFHAGWCEYRARFREGALHSIVRLSADEQRAESNRHFGPASFRWFAPPPRDDLEAPSVPLLDRPSHPD